MTVQQLCRLGLRVEHSPRRCCKLQGSLPPDQMKLIQCCSCSWLLQASTQLPALPCDQGPKQAGYVLWDQHCGMQLTRTGLH
jgi:hypothetical protein